MVIGFKHLKLRFFYKLYMNESPGMANYLIQPAKQVSSEKIHLH